MSGHSKWANIKRDKAANDSKKSKTFSKLSRLISVTARDGGGDVDSNAALRLAVEKAKAERMPKENIDRAINRGAGNTGEGANFNEVIYEGFGPNGEAFFIKGLTDNKNRTAAEIRNVFNKNGGSLGSAGSTSYIFSPDPEKPSYTIEITDESQRQKLEKFIEELDDHDDIQDIYVNFNL